MKNKGFSWLLAAFYLSSISVGVSATTLVDLDNKDCVFAQNSGNVENSSTYVAQSEGSDYAFTRRNGTDHLNGASWRCFYTDDEITAATNYAVYLRWTEGVNRCKNVRVEIRGGNTLLDTVDIDQEHQGSRWIKLGDYDFVPTTGLPDIRVYGNGTLVAGDTTNCVTTLDAVRILGDGGNLGTIDPSGFDQPFSADGDPRNVIVLRGENSSGSIVYFVSARFATSTFTVQVNGNPVVRPFVSLFAVVHFVSGVGVVNITRALETPDTAAFQSWLTEHATIDPNTLLENVIFDDERTVETCTTSLGGALRQCVGTILSAVDGAPLRVEPGRQNLRGRADGVTVNGLSFPEVLFETRFGPLLSVNPDQPLYLRSHLRAKGIGVVVSRSEGSTIGFNAIFYRIDGVSHGSLAGTPFEPGTGELDGLFFAVE